MGSAQSTVTNNSPDPWWPIENNNDLTLDQPINNQNHITPDNLNENSQTNNQISNLVEVESNQSVNASASVSESHLDREQLTSDLKNNNSSSDLLENCDKSIIINKNREQVDELQRIKENRGEQQTLEQFKEELRLKRMARQTAIDDLRLEVTRLRSQLTEERQLTQRLRNGEQCPIEKQDVATTTVENDDQMELENENEMSTERVPNEKVIHLQSELAETQFSLQLANAENLSLTSELGVVRKQVDSLKEVIVCSKQMMEVREEQVTQLKAKLREIEDSLAEREMKTLSEDLRREYDKQLANIRNLRQLYEERARVSAAERENLERQISIKKDELAAEIEKTKNLEERITTMQSELETSEKELRSQKSDCSRHMFENRELKEEMAVINKLFSQTLMGFNGSNCLDIDRLTTMLEENRTLLNEMATKEANFEGASLPKLLFDIVKQANNNNDETEEVIASSYETSSPAPSKESISTNNEITTTTSRISNASETTSSSIKSVIESSNDNKTSSESAAIEELEQDVMVVDDVASCNVNNEIAKVASAQEIIGNLPKVWRVLMELLNHHKIEKVEIIENGQSEDCYKSVQTPNGPKAELSVSKTYIKLKDLILEKKSLLKETTRLKTLNCHLENRLNNQEKRLSTVSLELTKTWHLVGKMQRQHRQLHTHEQILRYQLQQKRRLLTELKDELEYCRRKWAAARAKNDESQLQCDAMRREFAKRKIEDANNSAESGYSDGVGSDEEENVIKKRPDFVNSDFEALLINNKRIERRLSTSPGQETFHVHGKLQRSLSAPGSMNLLQSIINIVRTGISNEDSQECAEATGSSSAPSFSRNNGAVPKQSTRTSRTTIKNNKDEDFTPNAETVDAQRADRCIRINLLEEQCKSLIAQVLETSDCREKLVVQLCKFQDELPPVQHPIPLEEFIAKKRQSKSPSPQCDDSETKTERNGLTPREEEYTRKRSERIERLENESNLLMSRIKRTTVRGNNMKSLIDNIHSRCVSSREGSFDNSAENIEKLVHEVISSGDESVKNNTEASSSCLTPNEEDYSTRRSERLKRLEEESKSLLSLLSKNSDRGNKINSQLDELQSRNSTSETGLNLPGAKFEAVIPSDQNIDETTINARLREVGDAASKRSERLKIMEEESQMLLSKLSSTSVRGTKMIERLNENRKKKDEAIQKKVQDKIDLEETIRVSAAAETLIQQQKLATTSIVPEQTNEYVTVSQTASQIAQLRGARPKQLPVKPTGIAALQLSRTKKSTSAPIPKDEKSETLEEMFLRLSGIPKVSNSKDSATIDSENLDDNSKNEKPNYETN